jgi:hypothetical protein
MLKPPVGGFLLFTHYALLTISLLPVVPLWKARMTAAFQGLAGHGKRRNCQTIDTLIFLFAGMTYAYLKAKMLGFPKGVHHGHEQHRQV